MESVLNSPSQQKSLSQKLDSFTFHSLLSSASLVNKARMLSVTMESVLNSPSQQKSLSQMLDSFTFHSLLSSASLVNKARMLSVSFPHASSWITRCFGSHSSVEGEIFLTF